jgi:hypothetical protein
LGKLEQLLRDGEMMHPDIAAALRSCSIAGLLGLVGHHCDKIEAMRINQEDEISMSIKLME